MQEDSFNLAQELKGESKSIINNSYGANSQMYERPDCSNDKEYFYNSNDKLSTDNESFDRFSFEYECHKSHQHGSTFSNSPIIQDLLKNDCFGIVFCKKCSIPCLIDFMDSLEIKFECGCTYIEGINSKEFAKDYLNNKTKESKEFQIHCPYHKGENEFLKYCKDCGIDLCKECLNKNSELYSNTSKVNKAHENHTLIDLNEYMNEVNLKELEESINDYEKSNNIPEDEEDTENKELKNKLDTIFLVISSLIEHYKKYKNYNSYKSIKNAEAFLKKIQNKNESEFISNSGKSTYIRLMKQTSEKNFEENIKNHYIKMREISLKYIENDINFSIVKNINFQNLKKLIIRGQNFKDFYQLFSCQFPVLEYIDLEKNNIDNKIIEILKKIDLPELIYLSLYKNKITDEKIFDIIRQYKKIITFFIGENPIEFNSNLTIKYTFPESLEEFGMTGNLDPIKAHYINRLDLNNLKIFYFSRNKIDNLKYLEKFVFTRLVEFWAISNRITDINQLLYINGKENLVKINLKENQISNFDELIDIIQYFPNLKELNLQNNNIPESKAIEMKEKIKKIYNQDLKIKV